MVLFSVLFSVSLAFSISSGGQIGSNISGTISGDPACGSVGDRVVGVVGVAGVEITVAVVIHVAWSWAVRRRWGVHVADAATTTDTAASPNTANPSQ